MSRILRADALDDLMCQHLESFDVGICDGVHAALSGLILVSHTSTSCYYSQAIQWKEGDIAKRGEEVAPAQSPVTEDGYMTVFRPLVVVKRHSRTGKQATTEQLVNPIQAGFQ
eukprot:11147-Amphidinium_carterae.1